MNPALLIDFGSTYTKVAAVDLAGQQLLGTASAYTTVETDVTLGLEQALANLEQVTGPLAFTQRYACSSAAGGLRMVTSGLVPDLTGAAVYWETGAGEACTAELYFSRYEGDWNALLRALFAPDIKKVSHSVKDLLRALLESGVEGGGFVFDTALAAYLLDATQGSYELSRLFLRYFGAELPRPL